MVANASALRDRDGVRDDRESAMRALPAGRCNGASFARAYIQRTNDASSILASAQFSRSWRASWRLTACRYEQLTPPVARLAPPRSFSLGIWAPGMRAAGAARRASGLCRALRHSPRDQVIREDPAGAVVVRAWPGHRNIGRGSCRSALADVVERRSTAVVLG